MHAACMVLQSPQARVRGVGAGPVGPVLTGPLFARYNT